MNHHRTFEEFETALDDIFETASTSPASLNSKLERRRHIEALEEEKRLREELDELDEI